MADSTNNLLARLLVLRAQGGDRAAFEELIRTHHSRLRLFLHKMRPGHADDLAQEVWMDALRDLPRLADAGAFVPWLYRVARNRAYRALRRRPDPGPLPGQDVEATNGLPEFTAEDAAAVHAALDQLPPEQREVLLLRFIEDLSYEDIATATDVPVGTVRSRIHNAKAALRRIVERQGDLL